MSMPLMACSTRPAAALPERVLPQLLADAGRLVGPFADEERPEQLHRRLPQGAAREDAADADQAFVGDDLDDGVDVVVRDEFLRPPALDGAAGEAGEANVGDLHRFTPEPHTFAGSSTVNFGPNAARRVKCSHVEGQQVRNGVDVADSDQPGIMDLLTNHRKRRDDRFPRGKDVRGVG